MTEQLKPYPFCGSSNIEIHAIGRIAPAKCMGCGVAAPDAGKWNSRPSPWVPVSERLPEGTDRVLAYCANANGVFIGFYNPGAFWAIYKGSAYEGNVTHWMPLPPAPETKGE